MIVPPVATPAKSERVEKEKQVPLFTDLPGDSTLPPISLLDAAPEVKETISADTLEYTSRLIEKKLKDFGVEVSVVAAYPGPVVTRYEIEPATGVKGSQIVGLAKDLARSLSLVSIRVVETIPGKNFMALELPNQRRQTVSLSEILGSAGLRRRRLAADHGPRQGHRRQAGVRRSREDAALAGGRHDGLGQVGRDQRDDPVAALQGERRAGPHDPDRPEDARNERLRRHSASAVPGRHRHAAGRPRAELGGGRDGAPLQADEQDRRAQSRAASTTRSTKPPSATRRCRIRSA